MESKNCIIMFPSKIVISISDGFPYFYILVRYANLVIRTDTNNIIKCRWAINSLSDFGYDLTPDMDHQEFEERIQDIALGYDFKQNAKGEI